MAQNNDNVPRNNDQNELSNRQYEGCRYEHWFDNHRGGFGGRGRFYGNSYNRPRQPIQCFTCYKEGHRYADCPYKNITDLKLCTSCGVGDHSLEDCPTILEKINKRKNVNFLSCVKKNDIIRTKNLHIVTRQEMKIGSENPRISKIKDKNEYPNPIKQKTII